MRTTLTSVPILLGLLALALLYLLRWTILQEPLRAAIETAIFDATAVRVEVGAIHGNALREIRVDALRTIQPNPDGTVHSLQIDGLAVRYRLGDLLPFLSLTNLPLPRLTSPAVDTDWLERAEITAGLLVSNLSRTLPASFALDLRGEVILNTPEERSSARLAIRLGAGVSGGDRVARIDISRIASPWWPGAAGDTLSLVVSLAPGRLALSTHEETTIGGVRIDGALESSDADGHSTLAGADLTVAAGRFRARATAGPRSAELVASMPGDDRSAEFVTRWLARPDTGAQLVVGALDLEAVLRLPASGTDGVQEQTRQAGRSVVEELFSAPVQLVDDAEIDASVDARAWRFASVAVERFVSSAEWAGGNLTLGTTNAEVGVEGLDLATASDPSSGVVLSLERAEWDTSTNELGLADLGVRGAGGRMRIDGLVALPPAGSGLERVSGDLAGQLSVEQPDEFAALLGRLGIAPEMPEGYSIGTSLTADFALSGARANRADTQSSTQTDPRLDGRLSLGLRARGPFVPGLAFESIEVDATITSVSLATNSLRGQAIEVLAIATEPYSGADFTVSAEAAEWDAAAKEIRVGGLVAHAGGGRLRMDGLVSLPPDGSGLERVGGDLAGQLAIEEPDELAAVLARIGLAPPLPEGFSIGTSLALDFALGDARGELDDARPDAQPDQRIGGRLSAGLRARGPVVPGLTFESFEAEGAISSNSVTLDQLRVRTAGALGTLDGSGSFTADSLELELDADAIPLAFLVGLLDPDLSAGAAGTVSVRMHVEGSPESPTIALIAQGELLAIEGEPVTVAVNVRQEAGEIRLDTLTVDLADFAEVRGTGSAPLTFGTSGLAAGNLATAEMRIDASLPGAIPYLLPGAAERWPEAALELTSTLDGRAASVRASATGFERAEELTIVGIEPMTDFQLAASIADVLDLPSTLTAELTSGDTLLASVDTDLEGGLSGEARLPVAELSHFASGIDLPGGLLRASFRIPNDGTGARGEVTLENVMMKLSPLVPTVSSLNGSLIYADEIVRTDDLSGEMGGSPVSLSGSYSLLEREGGRMQVRLDGRNALLARSTGLQVRTDIDAELIGSFDSMRLSGEVGITEARYTRPVQLLSLGTAAASPSPDLQLFGVTSDWARSMLLDVAVRAERTIVVSNNLFDGSLSADLTIGGNLAVPRPAGRVFTDAGTVLLPTARLDVEELEVRFPADAAFAPQITLAAVTSVQGHDMSVTVDGQLPSVEVRIVSTPPLPTDEAILLLTTGSRGSDLSFAPDVSGTLTAVGTVVGRRILNRLSAEMTDDEQGFLERIDFEVERERETGQIGEVGVEYQLGDDENWVLRFDRRDEEQYTLRLGWRLWIE